jgi:hypothetical protein
VTDRAINSIYAEANWFWGTSCFMYEDDNCAQEIGQTGNAWFGQCAKPADGKTTRSWKCVYRC